MSTTNTTLVPPAGSPRADDVSAQNVTLPRVIRSEWIKLRSLRSMIVTLALTAAAVIATGVLVSMLSNGAPIAADGEGIYDPAGNSLFGATLAQVVLGVMGALVVTSEYSTGLIRTTLTAVPRRLPVLWAKVVVVAAAAFATMVASLSVAFFVGQAVYSGGGPSASLSDPGVLRAVLAAALFPTAIAVMGVAFGALMRHTATAIGILVAILFVLPTLFETLGGVWGDAVEYLPSEAGQAMIAVVRESGDMSPSVALLVLIGWIGVLLAAGTIALKRRDA
ncbi:ABC transporter permease [Phytoactinopolyspora halotolerans]|uniref:ABC transporter permease subunit n=1 Tax=Phytoactinopolyspora halotolerans TaxID=1981512 RepID=A0A6L9SA66_9ACTN|nr:ABC transporter permease [Phytoactinopolyspora halotolerans]NEE00850.1 ABC transporter permease subunit [Phytoactinopolyspora halotolerans]